MGKTTDIRNDKFSVVLQQAFGSNAKDISGLTPLKSGMTNRSYMFSYQGKRYIFRAPGEGTEKLIDRRQEAEVYKAIRGKDLCDSPVYFDAESGYKITRYLDNVRPCDPKNDSDIKQCLLKLKYLHGLKLSVPHFFDLFGQIDFYEGLWEDGISFYSDHFNVKERVFSLRAYVDKIEKEICLTHIDAVSDNFLFYQKEDGGEGLQLTDWEYAGMQDPHVDIAMFVIYSMYDRGQLDHFIDRYFEGYCEPWVQAKIYCYVAICGLLWSNWCEYKKRLGVSFGEYALRQYEYAKEYSVLADEMIGIL